MIVRFFMRRLLGLTSTLIVISVLVFVLIQLPPGDAITSQLELLHQQGREVSQAQIDAMRRMFYLDQPLYRQYLYWIGNFIQGDMGYSITFNKPVNILIWDRIGYTVLIAASCILFTWATALPIGIFSAVRQYSWGDYFSTVLGLLGIATPSFMLALILMYLGHQWFGVSVGGLFSPEMETE
ncbi:MAG: ABC transporter permease, partial [Candidatus Electrothrix sp. ATG2]|nr:ABC transporter permease [Candidatus Electrothrix sp. ATG2]